MIARGRTNFGFAEYCAPTNNPESTVLRRQLGAAPFCLSVPNPTTKQKGCAQISLAPLGKVAPQATDEVPIKALKTNLDAYPMGWQNPYSLQGVGAKRRRVLCVIVWKSDISTLFYPLHLPKGRKGLVALWATPQKYIRAVLWGPHPSPAAPPSPAGQGFLRVLITCSSQQGKA